MNCRLHPHYKTASLYSRNASLLSARECVVKRLTALCKDRAVYGDVCIHMLSSDVLHVRFYNRDCSEGATLALFTLYSGSNAYSKGSPDDVISSFAYS